MKCNRIFKVQPNKENFIIFLKEITISDNNVFVFYDELYKKSKIIIDKYFFELKDNYHNSKLEYISNINFNKCITLIKQLCKVNNIDFTSKRRYFNNSYKIYYSFILSG